MSLNHKVDFFIVGQPKSGTTALADFLEKHPEISISIPKELGYMSKDHQIESDEFHGSPKYFHIRTPSQYAAAFSHAKPQQILGEASTNYLYSKVAAKEIAKYNPNAKIIIMLRNPVDMIYSLYKQFRNENKEHAKTFEGALKMEGQRKKGMELKNDVVTPSYYLYKEHGLYYKQVERYLKKFKKNQVHIVIFDEFRENNARTYKEILEFLGVKDKYFQPKFEDVNTSKEPRSKIANNIFNSYYLKAWVLRILGQRNYTKIQREIIEPILFKRAPKKPLDPLLRQELERFYYNDVDKLSKKIGRDLLSLWVPNKKASQFGEYSAHNSGSK